MLEISAGIPEAAARLISNVSPAMVWDGSLLAALFYAVYSARRNDLNPSLVYWSGISAIVIGLWGGHLLGIYYYGTDGRPWAWLRFWSGGEAQYGGLIAGGLAAALFFIIGKLPILTYADALAPALALGVAIGRIGCFLNGDDYGAVSHLPWAVRFSPGTEAYADHLQRGWITPADGWSLPVHPVQLYCSLFWLGLFILLVLWHPEQKGGRLSLLLIAHGAGRFLEQIFRGDFRPVLGPLSLTQLISLLLIATGAAVFMRGQRSRPIRHSLEVVAKPAGS